MPPRATPFQRLVHHIQAQLAPTSLVQESAMLRHRLTEEEREVDVLITSQIGEHTLHVAVECIEHARPATVTWVEQQAAKHQHLSTNKLVLVSLAGFTEQALVLAERLGVECYSPDAAT